MSDEGEVKILGVIAQHGEEWVETEFSALAGIPLTPAASYYRRNDEQRYPIALHPQSVLKVYLGHHLAIAAVACAMVAAVSPAGPLQVGLFCVALAAVPLVIFARLRVGKLNSAQRKRREVHGQITGVNATPDMLPERLVQNLLKALERKWSKIRKRHSAPKDWREAVDGERDAETLALLAVLASFDHHLTPDRVRAQLAAKAWKLLDKAGGNESLESLSPDQALAVLTEEEAGLTDMAEDAEAEAPKKAKPVKAGACAKVQTARGIKIRCGRCETVTKVPEAFAGKTGLCPSCKKGIRVPSKKSIRIKFAA